MLDFDELAIEKARIDNAVAMVQLGYEAVKDKGSELRFTFKKAPQAPGMPPGGPGGPPGMPGMAAPPAAPGVAEGGVPPPPPDTGGLTEGGVPEGEPNV